MRGVNVAARVREKREVEAMRVKTGLAGRAVDINKH